MAGKPTGVDSKVPEQIEDEVLELAYKKSILFAGRKLYPFHQSGLLSKIEPLDLVNEAVKKTLSRQRQWNREKTPDLFVHLAGCIKSMISNEYTSADFQFVERDESSEQLIEGSRNNERSVEEIYEFESKVEYLIDYLVTLREDVKPVVTMMLKEGVTEPSVIAEELDMTVTEVNSKKLAIKRMMLRTDFLIQYISSNRQDLIAIALAIYKDKVVNASKLSIKLDVSEDAARQQRSELYSIVKDIHRGVI